MTCAVICEGRFAEKGYLFISADYRLIPPATGHEIVEDIQDLWRFLNDACLVFTFPEFQEKQVGIQHGAIAVAGVSAGGLCAYLCAMHCREPRPRAVLSLYGMGGDFLVHIFLVLSLASYLLRRPSPLIRPHTTSPPRLSLSSAAENCSIHLSPPYALSSFHTLLMQAPHPPHLILLSHTSRRTTQRHQDTHQTHARS